MTEAAGERDCAHDDEELIEVVATPGRPPTEDDPGSAAILHWFRCHKCGVFWGPGEHPIYTKGSEDVQGRD